MADALFVLIVLAFFGLMVLLVKACDHIIGPEEVASTDVPTGESADGDSPDVTAAPAETGR